MDARDVCPRCAGGFHCGVDDAEPCACSTLVLGPRLLAELRATYTSCLCLRCLGELAAEQERKGRPDLSTGRP